MQDLQEKSIKMSVKIPNNFLDMFSRPIFACIATLMPDGAPQFIQSVTEKSEYLGVTNITLARKIKN